MYELPTGAGLSPKQRQELDDTFLSSDPFSYFTARVAMMLRWAHDAQASSVEAPKTEISAFGLHLEQARLHVDVDPRAIGLQLATDAFALRQQASESLLRLVAAVLDQQEALERSLWECISAGPQRLNQVVESSALRMTDDSFPGLGDLLIREEDRSSERVTDLMGSLLSFDSWYTFAETLATDPIHQFHVANNKLKHGPAVRARDDVLQTFTSANPMRSIGTLSLSDLTGPGAHTISDPLLEVLSQAPKGRGRVWEVTQYPIDVDLLLSEAYMLAWTHGAIFSNAAERHFEGRSLDTQLGPPPFPGYPDSRITPYRQHLKERLQSFRMPLTVAEGQSPKDAKHIFGLRGRWIPATFGPPARGVVIDDTAGVRPVGGLPR